MTADRTTVTRVLGVDTSLRSSGVALVEACGSALSPLEYLIVKNPATRPLSECLKYLFDEITAIIQRGKPQAVAIEGIFFCKNVKTAVILGEARGVVLAASAIAGLPVYEYSPRLVKQSVVGYGAAGKDQVQQMVMRLLNLQEEPHADAADALAIALCHLNRQTRYGGLLASGKAI